MKKLSFKKKSVNDDIAINEPRPVKDRSIKHIFKMNFLPITFLVYSVVIITVVLLFMAGSSDETPGIPDDNDNSNIWTAQELADDMALGGGGTTSITFGYGSLNDGDEIVIKDTINSISYASSLDVTTVKFDYFVGYVDDLVFQGDITSLYATGDQVQISVTIKRVTFTLEPPDVLTEMTYDLEIFEKQWESKEYFVANGVSANALKPLPQSSITKV